MWTLLDDSLTVSSTSYPENVSMLNGFANNQTEPNAVVATNRTVPPALSAYRGHLDAAFVAAINPFWLQFEPPSASAHITLGCVHACIMTVGMLGNALVIFMFVRCRSLRTPANTLVINLAISDFCMLAKAPFMIYNSFRRGPALGDYGCRLYGFVGGLTGVASIATLTAISIDRYFVVVHPLDPLRNITKIRSRLLVCLVWLYSVAFAIVPALDIGLSRYVPEGYLTSCSFDYLDRNRSARIFMFVFFVCAWAVPFACITFCYVHILRAVGEARRMQPLTQQGDQQRFGRGSKDARRRTEMKVAGVVLAIIGLWFAAWTPYSVVALLGITGNERLITPLVSMVPAVFCKSAACIDPYVYAMTHPKFRLELRRLWMRRWWWFGRKAVDAAGGGFGGAGMDGGSTMVSRNSTMRRSTTSSASGRGRASGGGGRALGRGSILVVSTISEEMAQVDSTTM